MTATDVADVLAAHPLFAGVERPLLEELAGCGGYVRFATGDVILAENEPADSFYLLREGRVALETVTPGRVAIIVETLHPGDFLGWSWLLPPYRWHFDARAKEPTAAIGFDGACVRAKLDADPRLGYELVRRFAELIVDRLLATRLRLLDLYGNVDPR